MLLLIIYKHIIAFKPSCSISQTVTMGKKFLIKYIFIIEWNLVLQKHSWGFKNQIPPERLNCIILHFNILRTCFSAWRLIHRTLCRSKKSTCLLMENDLLCGILSLPRTKLLRLHSTETITVTHLLILK